MEESIQGWSESSAPTNTNAKKTTWVPAGKYTTKGQATTITGTRRHHRHHHRRRHHRRRRHHHHSPHRHCHHRHLFISRRRKKACIIFIGK